MLDTHVDVLLFSDDNRLADLVGKHRPDALRLRRLAPSDASNPPHATATQLWVDLDTPGPAPDLAVERRIYFHSRFDRRPAELPAGVFVRKPCSTSIIELLWAGVTHRRSPATQPRAAHTPPDLPHWIEEFHLHDLKQLCRRCVRDLPGRLGYHDASLYLYDADDDLLSLSETNHVRPIDLAVSLDRSPATVMTDAARARRLVRCDDIRKAPRNRMSLKGPDRRPYPDGACLVAPLVSDSRLLGVLNFSRDEPSHRRIPRAQLDSILAFVARSMGQARRFKEARTEARRDGLTGLANYRAFREALERETKRSQRYGAPLTLAMLDLDGLKAVNDQFGHAAGDFLLRNMTSRITAALRQFDTAARVGGDEFAIILPNTATANARTVASRMLRRFRLDPPRYGQRVLAITGSCGVAQFSNTSTADALVTAADQALYDAKRQGRNRVVCAAPPIVATPNETANTGD